MAQSLCCLPLLFLSCTPWTTSILPASLGPYAPAHEGLQSALSFSTSLPCLYFPQDTHPTSSPLSLVLPCPLPSCRWESPVNRHLSSVFVKRGLWLKFLSAYAQIPCPPL